MTAFNPTQIRILKQLADGQFHSSRTLAEATGLSRTAAWQQVRALQSAGVEMFAVHGKGTRLVQPLDLLDASRIARQLNPPAAAQLSELIRLDQTDSTNRYLMRARLEGKPSGTVCVAESQTEGKGRMGRAWVSPFAQNVYLSILWRFQGSLANLSGLSLACGVMAVRALERLGVSGVGLKWPNDMLWQQKKLGGILVEVQGETEGGLSAVIGLGLNVQMQQTAADDIDQPWVDLASIAPTVQGRRNDVIAAVLDEFLPMLAGFERTGLQPYVADWNRLDCVRQQPVRLISGTQERCGIAEGIDTQGALQLRDAHGMLHAIHGGELSLRVVESTQ